MCDEVGDQLVDIEVQALRAERHRCQGAGQEAVELAGWTPRRTRKLVLEWYGGVEVDEPIEVVGSATEVFLVSTTRDVQAVERWDDRELPAPGPVTREVQAVWRQREPELLGL